MEHYPVVVIHRKEWDRITAQANFPDDTPTVDPRDDIRKAQIEQSQKWIRSWPDSVEGMVRNFGKRTKRLKTQEIGEMKEFAEKLRYTYASKSKRAVQKAKQTLFYENGAGRELLSALYESKVLEEREAQIKFNNEIKEKATELAKEMDSKWGNLARDENEDEDKRNRIKRELAQYNKETAEKAKEKIAQYKECEEKGAIEDARLMKKCIDLEKEAENNQERKEAWNKALTEDREYREKLQEERRTREKYEDEGIACWRKHQDAARRKEKKIFDLMHKDRHATESAKNHYNLVKKMQDDEQKSYDDFVEKGIKRLEITSKLKEQDEVTRLNQDLAVRKSLAKHGKDAIEAGFRYSEGQASLDQSKCISWRQSLFTKPAKRRGVVTRPPEKAPQSFLTPSNPLVSKLKERQLDPSPYSGTLVQQKYYAQQAACIYEECTNKLPAYNIIKNYCQKNGVDLKSIIPTKNAFTETGDDERK